jgi:hypothetical protein
MFIFLSFSRVQWRVSYLNTYRYFFKRFLAFLCEGNSKDCEFFFCLFQYTSIQFYFKYCPNICSLTFHFKTILRTFFSQDLIGWSRHAQANNIFLLSVPCCLFICSYICLALKGTHLLKVLLLVFEQYNRKKEGKKLWIVLFFKYFTNMLTNTN